MNEESGREFEREQGWLYGRVWKEGRKRKEENDAILS